MSNAFDVQRFRELIRARRLRLGEPVSYRAVTASTNDDALAAARAGAPHGALFLADEQTQGRGRHGRVWRSAPGENLLVSLLVRPRLALERTSALTLAIGLALREAIAAYSSSPLLLKWPNDLLAEQKKLAGILVESQVQGGSLSAVVIGIGVNVGTQEFVPEIQARATSLALLGSTEVDREVLLADILAAVTRRLGEYEAHGIAALAEELERYDALRGRRVRVDDVVGTACGLDRDGRLLVEDETGVTRAISAGTVETL